MYGVRALGAWLILCVLCGLYLYFRERVHSRLFLASCIVLLAASLLSIHQINPASAPTLLVVSLYFGILFFILLGVKNLIFIHRTLPYYFLQTFLFTSVFMLFFNSDTSGSFIAAYFLLGAAAFFLLREFIGFNFAPALGLFQTPIAIQGGITAFVFAFLLMELVWVVALLSLGFLNAASFMVLAILLLEDLLLHALGGTLTRQIILRNATFFLCIGLVIFGFSKWTP